MSTDAKELEFIPVLTGGRTDYKLNGIPEAGISDVYRFRDRTVYQTIPCKMCVEHAVPCWRPIPAQGQIFLGCLLCERLVASCDELEVLHPNLILPPTPFRSCSIDISPVIQERNQDKEASRYSPKSTVEMQLFASTTPDSSSVEKFKQDDDLEVRLASDPEALRVKDWRHKLQKVFLSRVTPRPEDVPHIDNMFTQIETYDKMNSDYLLYSRIGKIMRRIAALHEFPEDNKYYFRERAQVLVDRWQDIIQNTDTNEPKLEVRLSAVNVVEQQQSIVPPVNINTKTFTTETEAITNGAKPQESQLETTAAVPSAVKTAEVKTAEAPTGISIDGSRGFVRSSTPLKLSISAKRSPITPYSSSPSPKRLRTSNSSDVTQSKPLDREPVAQGEASDHSKILVTSKRDSHSGYQIGGFPHVGFGDSDDIHGKFVYETQKCQPCRAAKRKNCWRSLATLDTFAQCTWCTENRLTECDTPPITEKTLVHPGAPHTGLKRQFSSPLQAQKGATTVVGPVAYTRKSTSLSARQGLDKNSLNASRLSPSTSTGEKLYLSTAELHGGAAAHDISSLLMSVHNPFAPLDPIPPRIKRVLRLDKECGTTTHLESSSQTTSIPLHGYSKDWWKGGLSLPDDLLIQQLSELKKAKILEVEARLRWASEEHATKSKALASKRQGMKIRLEAMRKVVEVMERDVDGFTVQIASNEAEFEQRKAECEVAKMRFSLL